MSDVLTPPAPCATRAVDDSASEPAAAAAVPAPQSAEAERVVAAPPALRPAHAAATAPASTRPRVTSPRRYGVLITAPGDDRGTWHTITAPDIGAALRGARTRSFWQAARIGYDREQSRVSAIECLGIVGH